jgi:hypothetical protein
MQRTNGKINDAGLIFLRHSGIPAFLLTLILTAWEFKKPFFVKMKISPGWLKQNIFNLFF